MSNTTFIHDIESVTVRHCAPQPNGTESVTISLHAIRGQGNDHEIHVFGRHETRTNPIPVEEIFDTTATVEKIEIGGLYRIPGFDDNGAWLDDRGTVYVTNLTFSEALVLVEGIWFDADYTVTRARHGQDTEYRSAALLPNRTATRI